MKLSMTNEELGLWPNKYRVSFDTDREMALEIVAFAERIYLEREERRKKAKAEEENENQKKVIQAMNREFDRAVLYGERTATPAQVIGPNYYRT